MLHPTTEVLCEMFDGDQAERCVKKFIFMSVAVSSVNRVVSSVDSDMFCVNSQQCCVLGQVSTVLCQVSTVLCDVSRVNCFFVNSAMCCVKC